MRRSLTVIGLVVLALTGSSCGNSDETAPPSSSDPGTPTTSVEVIAEDFAYLPDTIEVERGGEMTLLNRGYAFHDMTIEGENGRLIPEIESGSQATAVVDLEPGRYVI